MGEFSLTHILLVAVIFLIFFGPSRLPQLGQSLGKAIRGFKEGLNEIDTDVKEVQKEQPKSAELKSAQQTQFISGTTSESSVSENKEAQKVSKQDN